jgi:ribosomal protein S18 acetylase RimI-like enzyme
MPEQIHVRPARGGDLDTVATILVEGFRTKFEAAFRDRIDRAERIIARTLALEEPRGLPGLFVAELEGQVVGTIALRRRGQPEPPFPPSMGIFFEELGLWAGLRAMFYMSLLDQSFKWDEVYLSDVAVSAPFRRRGVGKAMIAHADKVTRRWNKRALVLHVSVENKGAIRLYQRLGYSEERRQHSLLTRWLLGIGTWVRMRKEV